jgi:AcrR family transcriptional regulator
MSQPTPPADLHSRRPRPRDRSLPEAILAAAEACFLRTGYAGTSMREIAEAAGVSKSLLHYHFESKERLFVEVQLRAYQRFAAHVIAAVTPISDGKDRGVAAFDALISALDQSNDFAAQAELTLAAFSNESLRAHVVQLRESSRNLLVRYIGELLGAEVAAAGITVEMAADLVWSVLNGIVLDHAFATPPEHIANAIGAVRFLTRLALGTHPLPATDPPASRR